MSHDCGSDGHDIGEIGHGHEATHDGGTLRNHVGRDNSGVLSSEKTTEVHVKSHGAVNLRTEFVKIARAMGMVPIDMYRPNLATEDRVERKILDWKAFTPPDDEPVMPSGHYPGATGWTRLWREWWQIGVRSSWWKFWEPPEPSFSQRTYLEITCSTWCYSEAGDLETHLVIKVHSLPVWDNARSSWIYDGPAFDRHKQFADKLAQRICQTLRSYQPIPQAAFIRKRLAEMGQTPPVVPSSSNGDTQHPPVPSMPRPKSPPSLGTNEQAIGGGASTFGGDSDAMGDY